jgi:cell division protein FtsL
MNKKTSTKKSAPSAAKTKFNRASGVGPWLIVSVFSIAALLFTASYVLYLFTQIQAQGNDISRLQQDIVNLQKSVTGEVDAEVTE